MAVYRNVSVNFWNDAKVDDEFTPEDKYFYLYLITNPHTRISGCYEIGMKQMERETGYNEDTIKRLLSRMENHHKVIRYNEQTKEILLINWSKYNWHKSEKLISAVLKESEKIKSEVFKKAIRDLVEKKIEIESLIPTDNSITETETVSVTGTVKGIDTLSIPYQYPIDTVSKSKSKRFAPPTVEEVRAYCQERGNNVNAEHFVDHYTSIGWKVGKNPMKDWKAAVRTWEKNEYSSPNNSKKKTEPKKTSYDLNEWEEFAKNFDPTTLMGDSDDR